MWPEFPNKCNVGWLSQKHRFSTWTEDLKFITCQKKGFVLYTLMYFFSSKSMRIQAPFRCPLTYLHSFFFCTHTAPFLVLPKHSHHWSIRHLQNASTPTEKRLILSFCHTPVQHYFVCRIGGGMRMSISHPLADTSLIYLHKAGENWCSRNYYFFFVISHSQYQFFFLTDSALRSWGLLYKLNGFKNLINLESIWVAFEYTKFNNDYLWLPKLDFHTMNE